MSVPHRHDLRPPRAKPTTAIDWAAVRERLAQAEAATKAAGHSPERAQSTLRRRARELAAGTPRAQPAAAESAEHVCFRLDGAVYGVETAAAREVVALRDVVPLPGVPAHVRGLINVRSRILPVVDLKRLWNFPSAAAPERESVVLVAWDGVDFGIAADEIAGVRSVRAPELRAVVDASHLNSRHLKGLAADLIVLDLAALLPDLIVDETPEA